MSGFSGISSTPINSDNAAEVRQKLSVPSTSEMNAAIAQSAAKDWSLGSYVDISSYRTGNRYTTPSDGYLYMYTRDALCYIGGASVRAGGGSLYTTVFIKKGLSLFLSADLNHNELVWFVPIR